jgi:wyosine [tRNA(Phe)-imidazoG37] synthetase (radical SAM superfamily)
MVHHFLPGLEWLSLLHTGELFSSPMHVALLQSIDGERFPQLGVEVFTNGVLLPQRWESIASIHPCVRQITMSIDAATKQTYEAVRAPARWEQMQHAMRFIQQLRETGQIQWFQCNFVARSANYREIIPFARMCLDHGATAIRYSVFDRTWHTEEEYQREIPYDRQDFADIVFAPELQRPEINVSILQAAALGKSLSA